MWGQKEKEGGSPFSGITSKWRCLLNVNIQKSNIITQADAALVLADRFSSNAAAEDTDVQFRVWAMKSAVKDVPLYVQV